MSDERAGLAGIAGASSFDPTKPNVARIYDYLLGGKNHFAADRQAAQRLVAAVPEAPRQARANRAFLSAAVRYAALHGISQYVDIGAGLPTSPNVHETARTVIPDARVVYIDNDPVAVTHARALLATDDLVAVVGRDARNPEAILADPGFGALIDLGQPVCVLLVAMLHFFTPDEADHLVAAFGDPMIPGSYLVISAGHAEKPHVNEGVQAVYGDTPTVPVGRPAAEIAAYFDGFELVPPGLVPLNEWRADEPDVRPLPTLAVTGMLAGAGRKRG